MDGHPGIVVSSVETTDWQPDPDVGGEMHVLIDGADAYAGMSRFADTPVVGPWTVPLRETFLVLEGAGSLEIEGAPSVELRVGSLVTIPAGSVATWRLTELPYKELWFFASTLPAE